MLKTELERLEIKYAPADNYVESNVCLCGKITLVDIEIRWHADNVPCAALPIVRQIDKVLIVVQRERDLVAIESPWAELHNTCLLIKREICYIDRARALINCWRHPEYFAIWIYQHVAFVTNFIVTVSTINKVHIIIINTENVNVNLSN